MSTDLDHKITLTYSGPYTQDATGEDKVADQLELEYIDEEHEDRSAGILGDWVVALPPNTDATDEAEIHWEELVVTIDFQVWCEAACEQTGGHDFTDGWNVGMLPNDDQTVEDVPQICTRCGAERLD